jgi:hypothetical protein
VKNLLVVCLGILVTVSATAPTYSQREEVSPFAPVTRIGEPPRQTFYMLSTSVNKYTIRDDGLGDVMVRVRKIHFQLKVAANSRIERLYYFEYEGDLLLLYEAGASGYLARLDQKSKTVKSTTEIKEDFEPPLMKDLSLVFSDGTVLHLN